MRPYIITCTERFFNFNAPHPSQIYIEDIATGLSNICRWGGQSYQFYSVAEHSLLVEKLIEEEGKHPKLRMAALLHDAAEAYLGDIPSPIKARTMIGEQSYHQLEKEVLRAIADALDLNYYLFENSLIAEADSDAFTVEAYKLFPSKAYMFTVGEPKEIDIEFMSPEKAKQQFIKKYYALHKLLTDADS
ncbi:hypothetical protein LCGC14_1750690 [marine sediment metagenome]|uniref:HD/PDEase domain-containing protein n=1 Tax=marine sediment metagenome TaxID=412755 RepID=A0A0F9H413_9ZZZZ